MKFDSERLKSVFVYNGEDKIFKGQLTLTKFDGQPLDTVFELGMFIGNYRVSKLEWPPMSPRLLEFAKIDKPSKNAHIISSEDGMWKPVESGEYEIETQLSGALGEHEIKSKRIKWILNLDKENLKIELKKGKR